jgi:protein TonB
MACLVRGLSGTVESPPLAQALDVRIVRLQPPAPAPAPPPVSHATQAAAASPKPVHAPPRHIAPPKTIAAAPPARAVPHDELAAPPSPPAPVRSDAASAPGKPAATNDTTPTPSAEASTNGPARAILQPLPMLPDDLREYALQAVAMARFSIHTDGSVEVELIKPTHEPRLNQLLLDALKKWRFFPAMKNGQPVESSQDIRVHFNVD